MHKIENYRPDTIDFTVEGNNNVPESLGEFKTDDAARIFMAENLLALQSKLTTERFMDQTELEALRDQYADQLENVLPELRADLMKKTNEMERAKTIEKEAKEMVNASRNMIEQLANEVNERVTEIELDPATTWEVVYDNRRYYYTYMDKQIKLAAVRDIPSYEMDDLISSSERNGDFFAKQMEVLSEDVG